MWLPDFWWRVAYFSLVSETPYLKFFPLKYSFLPFSYLYLCDPELTLVRCLRIRNGKRAMTFSRAPFLQGLSCCQWYRARATTCTPYSCLLVGEPKLLLPSLQILFSLEVFLKVSGAQEKKKTKQREVHKLNLISSRNSENHINKQKGSWIRQKTRAQPLLLYWYDI